MRCGYTASSRQITAFLRIPLRPWRIHITSLKPKDSDDCANQALRTTPEGLNHDHGSNTIQSSDVPEWHDHTMPPNHPLVGPLTFYHSQSQQSVAAVEPFHIENGEG
jgi:hypothetical protein